MTTREQRAAEELFGLDAGRAQRDQRDQVTRGRIRVGPGQRLALQVFELLVRAVGLDDQDRVIAERAVGLFVGELGAAPG